MFDKGFGIPDVMIGAVLIALVAVGIAIGNGGGSGESDAAAATVAEVKPVARGVEQIRGLRFKQIPKPVVVTPAQTRDAQLRDLDRSYPPAQRKADSVLLATLGLIPKGTDLREVLGAVLSQEVAGYYDPKSKKLAIVNGPAAANRVLTEISLAHELDHALDDQRLGLHEGASGTDDRESAYTALVEGTATAAMDEYARRFIPPGSALLSVFSALPAASVPDSVPPYLQRSLEFSYTGGERFVSALRDREHGRWTLVNRAIAKRPPVSTEQVMHPKRYLSGERPLAVPMRPLGLDGGWKRTRRGTIGEFDTRELLRVGNVDADAERAAAGWGGGRYELWQNGAQTALVVRWRWDTPGDAREFDAALPLYLLKGLKAKPAGASRWTTDGGGVAVDVHGSGTSLAFAPTPQAAAALARP